MDDDIQLLLPDGMSFDQTEDGANYDNGTQATIGSLSGDTEADMNSRVLAPALPASKTFHLFICYASEDRDRVFPIVTDLETKFGAKCLFADRDFQPGKEIRVNIEDGINNSVKILTVLSPNFTRSPYCMHESEIAFQKSMETGLNYVIPVLLEECEIPYGLKPKTYIDATLLDMNDTAIAHRITMALNQPESTDALLSYDMISADNKYKNGFGFDIEAQLHRCCWCRPSVYKFNLDGQMHSQKATKIKITPRQLNQAISLLNRHPILQYHDLQNNRKICVVGLCCYPALAAVITAILFIFALATREHQSSDNQLTVNLLIVCIIPFAVAMAIIFCVCLCRYGKRKIKKLRSDVSEKLWRQATMRTYRDCVAFSFMYSAANIPTLRVMRYDVSRCRTYIAGRIREANTYNNNESGCELQATRVTEQWLKKLSTQPLSYLPDAPTNRHNVVQDKMCICQLFERYGY